MMMSPTIGGRFKVSSAGISVAMKRMTAEIELRCVNADKRKRPTPDTPKPLLSSCCVVSVSNSSGVMISESRLWIIALSINCWLIGIVVPLTFMWTADPTAMNRSDARFSAINLNRRSIAMADPSFSGTGRVRCRLIDLLAQQLVDAGLRARLCGHLLDDDRAI